jgi:hypothetical protein
MNKGPSEWNNTTHTIKPTEAINRAVGINRAVAINKEYLIRRAKGNGETDNEQL